MIWCEFIFETPHPQNPSICIRFVITTPVPSAHGLREGAIVENRIHWRGEDRA